MGSRPGRCSMCSVRDDRAQRFAIRLGLSDPCSRVASVNPRNVQILDQIRAEALERDIPAADVERWMGLDRKSVV